MAAQPQLQTDESFTQFGAQMLLQRLQALTKEIEGVRRADDIEYIHRMRVASRRIRSALALFGSCFSAKSVSRWQKQVKRITRSLGAARDTDVQMAFLEEFLVGVESEKVRPGIERLLLRLRQKREGLQEDVLSALERLEGSGVLEDMEDTFRETIVTARLHNTPDTSPYIYEQAYRTISLRLEEMLSYEPYVAQPECVTQHHALRIAAKRLRYSIENFESKFGRSLKKPISTVKQMQEALGDIHDCDVWVDYLPVFMDEEKQRTREYFGTVRPFTRLEKGLKYLQDERRQMRIKRHKDFVELWEQNASNGIWDSLRDTLRNKIPTLRAQARRDAAEAKQQTAEEVQVEEAEQAEEQSA